MSSRIELQGTFSMRQVPDVRRFIERVHHNTITDIDVLSRLAMATHELCENAIKFSSDGAIDLRIVVQSADGLRLCVETKNRASAEHRSELDAIARGLKSAPNLHDYYVALMKASPNETGGLGLLRIAAEAEMTLDIAVDGESVAIHAELSA